MSGTAGEGFGSHPFGEIAKATVAAQVRGWNDAFLRLLEAAPGAQPRRPERG
jgi:hypothetical protein